MDWFWISLIFGAGIAPWLIVPDSLRVAFQRSVLNGIGFWLGMALMTTPIVLMLVWIGVFVLR